jgi:hypothetical protein
LTWRPFGWGLKKIVIVGVAAIVALVQFAERRKIKDDLACLVLRADPVRDGNATIAIYVHKSILKFSSVSGLYLSPGSGKRIVSRIDIHFDIQI